MRLRRGMYLVLVLVAVAVTACNESGEPSWILTSSSSVPVFHGAAVEDRTGKLLDWEYGEDVDSWPDLPSDFRWGIRQVDARSLEIGWWGLPCDDDPRLVIESGMIELTLDGYLGDRPDPEVGCAMMGIWREFRLTFAEPVAAESVTLEVIEPPA